MMIQGSDASRGSDFCLFGVLGNTIHNEPLSQSSLGLTNQPLDVTSNYRNLGLGGEGRGKNKYFQANVSVLHLSFPPFIAICKYSHSLPLAHIDTVFS